MTASSLPPVPLAEGLRIDTANALPPPWCCPWADDRRQRARAARGEHPVPLHPPISRAALALAV